MAVELFDDIDTNVLASCKSFRGRDEYFNANAAKLNRQAETAADVVLQFPYPPKDCEQATTIIQNIEDQIKSLNEKLASGGNKVDKRYLDAYIGIRNNFKAWLNAKQCVATALKQEDDAFSEQLQTALNQEQTSQDSSSSKNNWIIFTALGFLVLGAVAIILKRPKK
jgi:hypothetical protein